MSRNSELLGTRSHNRPPRLDRTPAAEVIRRLDLTVGRRLDGLLQGDHLGLVPGHGSEPGEARTYAPGDDVRRIDWNVSARLAELHVRDTIADHELETWILADLSPSLDFGTADCEKRDLAVAGAAAVGYLTARAGNRIGAVTVTPEEIGMLPARGGRRHLQALLHRLVSTGAAEGSGATELTPALARLDRIARRRGLVVVISDFLASDAWAKTLRGLGTRHEVLAIEIVDPRELELPDVGVIDLVDPETGAHREVQTGSAKLRDRYAAAATEQRNRIARDIQSAGADHLRLRTDRDWLLDLAEFVTRRRRRVERTGLPI